MFIIFLILFLYFGYLAIKRLYTRAFWVSTTARIVGNPKRGVVLFGFLQGGGVWADVSYRTDQGMVTETCKLFNNGEGCASSPIFWQRAWGISIPVYYSPKCPNKVVFMGSIIDAYLDIVVEEDKIADWIYAAVCVGLLLFAVLAVFT